MKFSRNPYSGLLECYTDDGVYIGNVYTMGDSVEDASKNNIATESSNETKDSRLKSENWGNNGLQEDSVI